MWQKGDSDKQWKVNERKRKRNEEKLKWDEDDNQMLKLRNNFKWKGEEEGKEEEKESSREGKKITESG